MKYFIAIFVTAVLVFFGATVYYKGLPTFPSYNKTPVSTQSADFAETPTPIATATASAATRVKAGGILVFHAYTIDVPFDWTFTKEATATGDFATDKLILTKSAYKITIYEAPTGGAACLYPGDPDLDGPTSRFASFVNITTATGEKLRRGMVTGVTTGFTVCEFLTSGYGVPTSFGHITITTPVTPAQATLDQIDSILSSLRKI